MTSEYPKYRESDIKWVDRIPAHWQTAPLLSVLEESKALNTGMAENNLLSLSYGRIVRKDIEGNEGLLPESFETYQIVEPDYLVFRLTDLQNDQRSLRSARVTERGIITSAYTSTRPKGIDPRYAEYLMRSYDTTKVFYGLGGGVRQSLTFSVVARIPVLLPSVSEQHAIGAYLDRETARIETLIVEQQRLVAMLRERRTATVSWVLARGLDASVPLKPSGVEALGEVPEDWRVVPTRYLCTIATGGEDSGNATDDGEFPFYVRGREILRIGKFSFDCEAVMTPGDGQGGVGKVFHYANGRFEAHQRVYIFKDFKGLDGRYFYYYLSTFLAPVALAGNNKVTMESLRRPMLAELRVALPPLDQQQHIVAHLEEQTSKIDALIAESERFIELSRERRSALITAAVTGQIDVRGEVA